MRHSPVFVDPLGVLNEGEIHFRSSQDIVEGCLYLDPKTIVGDVLVRAVVCHTRKSMLTLRRSTEIPLVWRRTFRK